MFNFTACITCLSTYPSLSPPVSISDFLTYFKGNCWDQFTSPLNTSACILLTRIQYVFVVFIRWNLDTVKCVSWKWTIKCFDKCVILAPMPIWQGKFELNAILFCYMLILKCFYPVRGDSTVNWALWKIPFICLTLVFSPTSWKTLSDVHLENDWLKIVCRIVKGIIMGGLGSNPSFSTFWLYDLGQSVYSAYASVFASTEWR